MKRLFVTIPLLFLVACGNVKVGYELDLTTDDAERRAEVAAASVRMIERRLASIGEEIETPDIEKQGDMFHISLNLPDESLKDMLDQDLTSPFKLRVMIQTPEEESDITVEGHGGFSESGLTENDLEWLHPEEEANGKGRITIVFTEEGRSKMEQIFEDNNGKFIGIFVRDQLVSKLLVDTDQLRDDIIITEIPTADLARVFADDVNVGLYAVFTPLQ